MSKVFVDTSAAYALLVDSDSNHSRAAAAFGKLAERLAPLLTTSYVLVETYALLCRRAGLEAGEAFRSDVQPLLETVWVGGSLHERGLDLLFERGARDLSLVDAVSFLVMRDHDVAEAFAYDRHFEQEGFTPFDG